MRLRLGRPRPRRSGGGPALGRPDGDVPGGAGAGGAGGAAAAAHAAPGAAGQRRAKICRKIVQNSSKILTKIATKNGHKQAKQASRDSLDSLERLLRS